MDDTAEIRRELIARGVPQDELDQVVAKGGQVWGTAEMQRDFEVRGFAAPLVVVRRKSDGALGSLVFTHSPRFYFGWEAYQE